MQKFLKINFPIIILLFSIAFVNSIPTSVLVNTKDVKVNNSKVKRSSNSNSLSSSPSLSSSSNLNIAGNGIGTLASTSDHHKSDLDSHSILSHDNNGINVGDGSGGDAVLTSDSKSSSNKELLFGANRKLLSGVIEPKSTPQKRGVNTQLLYNDIFGGAPLTTGGSGSSHSSLPNGIWTDEIDPSIMYQDLQDFDDYPRGFYRAKPYDNLQSILNAEINPEPVALPLQYPYRYYGDRKKRSNKKTSGSSYDIRLKRESKLTPADMLALVALVEAGERSRQESAADNDEYPLSSSSSSSNNDYSKPFFGPYDNAQIDEIIGGGGGDYYNSGGNMASNSNSWVDPAIDYYGMPYNLDSLPRYDLVKDQRLTSNYYPSSKRYMITKKKRSLGHFLNEPVPYPSLTYDNRFSSSDLFGKGPKRYQKYF